MASETTYPRNTSTPLLDDIDNPSDLRRLTESDLKAVADELRQEVINAVSVTGGHLGAGLGVVELTVALHYVFDTPRDRLIWDVGHQAYPHKMLTGRRDRIRTLRQGGGLSGFTKRSESEYDPFGAAHSSTSISSALGMAVARDLQGGNNNVIAVIGDGAMSAGMAYEAMNNAGSMDSRLIVILNDNDMSIAPPVGAMSAYLSRLLSSKEYRNLRHFGRRVARLLPVGLSRAAARAEEYARGMVAGGGTLFEELGFYYVGPIDGHNLDHLLPVLKNVRDSHDKGPVLIHVVTQKGHGYPPAEAAADKYHGVVKFDVATGAQVKGKAGGALLHQCLRQGADRRGRGRSEDRRHHRRDAVGHGPRQIRRAFPRPLLRCRHRRAARRHLRRRLGLRGHEAVRRRSIRPSCSAPTTRWCTTSPSKACPCASPWTAPGWSAPTARPMPARSMSPISAACPASCIMAAADEAELMHMVATAAAIDDRPSAVRYPRGEGIGVAVAGAGRACSTIGKGRIVKEGTKIAILSFGARLQECLKAAEELANMGLSTTVADARFAKPIDTDLVERLAREHEVLITIEEGADRRLREPRAASPRA